jgi:hypothetical protein
MALTNSERQALYRKRRKAELDELRKAAATSRPASPAEPLRNTEPLRYGDVDREVEEIEATLEDVKSEFADLVQELGEFFDDFICGLGNLTNDCERLLGNRLQTLRNRDHVAQERPGMGPAGKRAEGFDRVPRTARGGC